MFRLAAASRCRRSDAIAVQELSYNLGDALLEFQNFDDSENGCTNLLYGIESVSQPGSGY